MHRPEIIQQASRRNDIANLGVCYHSETLTASDGAYLESYPRIVDSCAEHLDLCIDLPTRSKVFHPAKSASGQLRDSSLNLADGTMTEVKYVSLKFHSDLRALIKEY